MRERKKRQTRDALRNAAIRLSMTHGVANVTVEQIADEADVATRTFFNHFSSKEEAIVSGYAGSSERYPDALRERPAEEPMMTAIRAALHQVIAKDVIALRNAPSIDSLRMIITSPELLPHTLADLADYERRMTEAVAHRLGRDAATDLDSALLAACITATRRVVVAHWLEHSRSMEPEDMVRLFDYATDLLDAGFAAALAGEAHG